MKTKSKIILFVCAFVLIFSVLSVSCFASVDGFVPADRYVFSPSLSLPVEDSIEYSVSFVINGLTYYDCIVNPDFIVFGKDSLAPLAFSPALGWIDESTQPVDVDYLVFVSGSFSENSSDEVDYFYSLFNVYSESDPDSFYNQIFNSISGAVFGEDDLTPEQNLSLSLISIVVSIGLVLLPVLLVIGFLLRCFRL